MEAVKARGYTGYSGYQRAAKRQVGADGYDEKAPIPGYSKEDFHRELESFEELTGPDFFVSFEDIEMEEELGQGSFSTVYRAYLNDNEVAVKVLTSHKFAKEFVRELYCLWKSRENPYVIRSLALDGNLII